MTEREQGIIEAIGRVRRFKTLARVVPNHALLRDVTAIMPQLTSDEAADMLYSLDRMGMVRIGRTLNDIWCDLPKPISYTDTMNEFEKTIKAYLDGKASEDADFRAKYEAALNAPEETGAKKKDIPACCSYIIAEVRKTGRQGFSDPEIFGMAMHFYDEADIAAPEKDEQEGVKVVVNKTIELSAADKKRIEAEARKKVEDEERAKAEKKIRDEKERQRKREEEKARKAKEAADARRKEQEAQGFGFLFGDDDFQ